MIMAVDAGNFETKVCTPRGLDKFCSAIGDFRVRVKEEKHGNDDMVWEYDLLKGFAGTLAKVESEFGGTMYGNTKNHLDATLRVLLAIHRNCYESDIHLAIGNPYQSLTKDETDEMKVALEREHTLTINGIVKTFTIRKVIVMAEGAAAYWSNPVEGLARIIDIGSGTVNLVTILNRKIVDKESFTAPYGMLTSKDGEADPASIARAIINDTSKKWKRADRVFVVGGASERLFPFINTYYSNSTVLKPRIYREKGIEIANEVFANVVGMYEMAQKLFLKVV
ncbi:ParM/StbA family protein [Gottfriedia solisilvae]|uniref:Actin-like protein N-terminal domain-containing protein n=1 Tax=Gottfriedia solisilvae TaxID=1516104 RepID=A0A8J3AQ05_9BACI|nr:ParM/StbA family protein [Gottfriedia solisilvae]GGI18023.1 hypothetical protein GCM10007380_40860 [Gottfriedia solisilvae]